MSLDRFKAPTASEQNDYPECEDCGETPAFLHEFVGMLCERCEAERTAEKKLELTEQ